MMSSKHFGLDSQLTVLLRRVLKVDVKINRVLNIRFKDAQFEMIVFWSPLN